MAVAAARTPFDVYQAALDSLERALGVERASVLLFDSAGVMRFKAWRGLSDVYRAAVEGHSPWSPQVLDAEPILVPDIALDASLAGLRGTLEAEGIRSLAFIPLALGERLLGKFMLYYAEPHDFAPEDVLTAQTIAAHVAFGLDQQAHRLSEQRYRGLIESVGVAVYATDAHGYITYYNEEAAALWGRRPEPGEKRWCGSAKVFWADGTPMALDDSPIAQAVRSGKPVRGVEAIAERPDGTRVHFIPYPTPLFDDAGNVTGAINVLVDITDRKRAETALQHNERRLAEALAEKERLLSAREETIRLNEVVQAQLASLIEASGALISGGRRDAAVKAILEIAAGLLGADAYSTWRYFPERDEWAIDASRGLSDDYVAGSAIRAAGASRLAESMTVEDVFADQRLSNLLERYKAEGIRSMFVAPLNIGPDSSGTLAFYYRQPHRFSDLEVRVATALSNLASASLTAAQLFEENERAREELHRANRELEITAEDLRHAAAAKDEFLSLVSHELKTPLTTIRGNAGVLFRNPAIDGETRRTALADIVAESERLHRIIENLLLLARAEQGRGLEEEPLLVVRVVKRVIERHRQHNPTRMFQIQEHQEPRPVVFSEPALEQLTENLISNAEKYSPPHESICIEIEREPHEVRVRVLDRGPGISEDESERIFEPFYRSGSMISRAEGLGIALAVCKRLVEAQGGRIWARPRPDGGSEFGFALPITEDYLAAEP